MSSKTIEPTETTRKEIDEMLSDGYQTTDQYLLDMALRLSNENKKKLLKTQQLDVQQNTVASMTLVDSSRVNKLAVAHRLLTRLEPTDCQLLFSLHFLHLRLLFNVPGDPKTRKKWMTAVKRMDLISLKTKAHCCEDHLDTPGTPAADLSEAGTSGISSRRARTRNRRPTLRAEEPAIVVYSSSSDEQDPDPKEPEEANQTENSEGLTWALSPISLPTSPAAPENESLASCLLRSVPLISILSLPRKESNNPHVPKNHKTIPQAAAPVRNEPEIPPPPQNMEQTSSPIGLDLDEIPISTAPDHAKQISPRLGVAGPSKERTPTSSPSIPEVALIGTIVQDSCSEQYQHPPRSVADSDLPPWKRYSRGSPIPLHSIPTSPILSTLNEVSQSSITKSPVDPLADQPTPMAQQQTSSTENPGLSQGVLLQHDQNHNMQPLKSFMASGPTQTNQAITASVESMKPKMIQEQRGQSGIPKAPTHAKKRLERSASLSFRPGELSDTHFGEICLGRTRSETAKIQQQQQQSEPVFKLPTLRQARFVKHKSKNLTPVPLDQFRNPTKVPHRGLERSASMIFTPGQFEEQTKVGQTIPTEKQFSERNAAYKLRSDLASNTKSSQNINQHNSLQARPNTERSTSVIFTPGQTAQSTCENRILAEEISDETPESVSDPLAQFRYQLRKTVQNQPNRCAERSASIMYMPGQLDHQSCSGKTQAANKTPENVSKADPLDQFRHPKQVSHRGLERSASMIYTPGQFADHAQAQQTVRKGKDQQLSESNAAYNLRSALAGNTKSSHNINQQNSLQERPNIDRSASMIYTPDQLAQFRDQLRKTAQNDANRRAERSASIMYMPGQLDRQNCSKKTQAAEHTPQNVSETVTDPLNQFRYPIQAPHRGLERSASMIYTPGQFEDQARIGQKNPTGQPFSKRIAAYIGKLRSALTGNTGSSHNINQQNSLQARPNIDRSASMVYTPGQLAQSTRENKIPAEKLPNETPQSDPLAQFRYQLRKTTQNEANRRAERSASVIYTPGQFDHQSCSRKTQADNETPENLSEADPMAHFRYQLSKLSKGTQVTPYTQSERSASMMFTPGQLSGPSCNKTQDAPTEKAPEPGQMGNLSVNKTKTAETPENDPMAQFRYQSHKTSQVLPNPGQERATSTMYRTGQTGYPGSKKTQTTEQAPKPDTRAQCRYQLRKTTQMQNPGLGRSASMFAHGQQGQPESNYRKEPNEVAEYDPMTQLRYHLSKTTESAPNRQMERSASTIYTPGQFENQMATQARAGQQIRTSCGQDATAQFHHNMGQSAPNMVFTQAQQNQMNYPPPPLSQQIPVRTETGYQHTQNNAFTGQEFRANMSQAHFLHTRPTPTQHTDQMNPENFMHANNQWVQPPAYNTRQTSNLNWNWQNNQATEQTAHNYGHTDNSTYQTQRPTQATSTGAGHTPHYYTRQARAAFDAAGHNNAYNAGMMQTPAQASHYAQQAQYAAYNADAAYQEQLYMAAALPPPQPPPLYVCRRCSKPYKTQTGLKNHLRRMCENPYHRYPMR